MAKTMVRAKNQIVSIITPYYRGTNYIEQSLKSVAAQNYPHIEHILIDDNIPEYTKDSAFLRKLQKKYSFKLIKHNCNKGISDACLTGLNHATGDYLVILHHDDWLAENSIAKRVAYMQRNPEIVASYMPIIEYYQKNQKTLKTDLHQTEKLIQTNQVFPSLYINNNLRLTPQGLTIRTDIAKEICTPIWNKFILDDWPIHIRLLEKYPDKIGILHENLIYYRIHDKNDTVNRYRLFSKECDTIAHLCPQHLKRRAIRYAIRKLQIYPTHKMLYHLKQLIKKILEMLIMPVRLISPEITVNRSTISYVLLIHLPDKFIKNPLKKLMSRR